MKTAARLASFKKLLGSKARLVQPGKEHVGELHSLCAGEAVHSTGDVEVECAMFRHGESMGEPSEFCHFCRVGFLQYMPNHEQTKSCADCPAEKLRPCPQAMPNWREKMCACAPGCLYVFTCICTRISFMYMNVYMYATACMYRCSPAPETNTTLHRPWSSQKIFLPKQTCKRSSSKSAISGDTALGQEPSSLCLP